MTNRRLLVLGLLVALVLAGVVSFYASSSPDGLSKVAADHGLTANEKSHQLKDAPFAHYGTKGVGNARLSTGLAGIAGVAITLTLGSALVLAVRRRDHGSD
jgi:cobalt/nickel transport system permease protein